jgi:hypothetical protein
MKKRTFKFIVILCIVILSGLVFTVFVYRPIGTGNTVQEAVQLSGRTVLKVIYEDKVKNGEVIYFIENDLDYDKAQLAIGFVRKTPWGWKWIYGGGHGSINSYCKENGFSAMFLPAVEGTPFPLYHGAIIDPEIDKIIVTELQGSNSNEAKIVGSGSLRVWYTYIGNLKGSKFNIKAYSKDGKEISAINDDMSPYSADQKPLKQQSASSYLKEKFGDSLK